MIGRRQTGRIGVAAAAAICALALPANAQEELPFLEYARIDPREVMTAEACGECHSHEYEVWKRTPHATSFKSLHRLKQAEAIAAKLGFRLIKRQSFCYSCHYTPVIDDGDIRVVSGPSCESCHGAGKRWIDLHNDYGTVLDHRSESAEHRRQRIERSREAGMRRPSDLYPVVANCFGCHTVPNERLINVGGHTTGSSGFEFVEWSQGEIRHNFLQSSLTGGEPANVTRPMPRKRTMYVVGRALDLEYSLRGMAMATESGAYALAMQRRVRSAVSEMREISRAADLAEAAEMLAVVSEVSVVPGNEAALLQAAERVGAATRRFLDGDEGALMASLDPLILGIEPQPEPDPGPETRIADTEGGGEGVGTVPEEPAGGSGTAPASTPGTSPRATPAVPVEGVFKRRLRPPSEHRTLGPGACGGCHAEQNEWWAAHAHFKSMDPFFYQRQENVQIARLYGLSVSQMTRGDHICMECHGTVVSGKESRDAIDGVSCERCHGAAADWLEPHKVEGGPSGPDRPGYRAALERGKRDLKRLEVRAAVCTGCHYVTEPRLLSAGHSSGIGFDYVEGMASVRHWRAPPVAGARLAAAFDAALAKRGDVPKVRLARAAGPATGGDPASAPLRGGGSDRGGGAPTVPPARPAYAGRLPALPESDPGVDLRLPPFPEIEESATFEERLVILQERLRLLHRRVTSATGGGQ